MQDKKRRCTDTIMLIALLACWFVMTVVGLVAVGAIESGSLKSGKIERLLAPMDYNGKLCGYEAPNKNKDYAYYRIFK